MKERGLVDPFESGEVRRRARRVTVGERGNATAFRRHLAASLLVPGISQNFPSANALFRETLAAARLGRVARADMGSAGLLMRR